MIEIKSAKYISDYKIEFTFNDGTINTTDLSEYILKENSPYTIPFIDKNKFKRFKNRPR